MRLAASLTSTLGSMTTGFLPAAPVYWCAGRENGSVRTSKLETKQCVSMRAR